MLLHYWRKKRGGREAHGFSPCYHHPSTMRRPARDTANAVIVDVRTVDLALTAIVRPAAWHYQFPSLPEVLAPFVRLHSTRTPVTSVHQEIQKTKKKKKLCVSGYSQPQRSIAMCQEMHVMAFWGVQLTRIMQSADSKAEQIFILDRFKKNFNVRLACPKSEAAFTLGKERCLSFHV